MSTVFIIGAGASKEFDTAARNMPVGSELAVAIEDLVSRDLSEGQGPVSSALSKSGGYTEAHKAAMVRIRDGIQSKDSIDDFLSEWDDIPDIGRVAKLAIAHVILNAERQSILGQMIDGARQPVEALRHLKHCWLGIVGDRSNPSARRRDVEQVFSGIGFVTFNYDRCIEQFLLSRFTHTLALSSDAAREALGRIPIYHAYGSLGNLADTSNRVDFGASDMFTPLAASGIITYTEEVETNRVKQIRELISVADKLVFLGCAYHPQNLELLFGDRGVSSALTWGTAYEMRDRSVNVAEQLLKKHSRAVVLQKVTCSQLLLAEDDDIFVRDLG